MAATLSRAGATSPSNGWNTSPSCSRPAAGAAFTAKSHFLENIQEAKIAVETWRRLSTREASSDNSAIDMSWLGHIRTPCRAPKGRAIGLIGVSPPVETPSSYRRRMF